MLLFEFVAKIQNPTEKLCRNTEVGNHAVFLLSTARKTHFSSLVFATFYTVSKAAYIWFIQFGSECDFFLSRKSQLKVEDLLLHFRK